MTIKELKETCDYYIRKFSRIPRNKWYAGNWGSSDGSQLSVRQFWADAYKAELTSYENMILCNDDLTWGNGPKDRIIFELQSIGRKIDDLVTAPWSSTFHRNASSFFKNT